MIAVINKQTLEIIFKYPGSKRETTADWAYTMAEPLCAHVEIPAELDPDCVVAVSWQETVVVVDEPASEEQRDPETGGVILPGVEAKTHEEIVTKYGLELSTTLWEKKQERLRLERVEEAYKRMWADVLVEMERVHETKDMNSATANFLTWKEMLEAPSDFIGEEFADEAAVIAFAAPKVAAVRAYGKWRDARKAAFRAEREKILIGEHA